MFAESAFKFAEYFREDLVFEVWVGVGVVDDVDDVLGEEEEQTMQLTWPLRCLKCESQALAVTILGKVGRG